MIRNYQRSSFLLSLVALQVLRGSHWTDWRRAYRAEYEQTAAELLQGLGGLGGVW